MCMNVYVCEALTANLGLGAISSLVYSYYYYYYICKALRANPRLGEIGRASCRERVLAGV